jgi:formylglycine-generating enzyme required for sulfatase activity
MTHKTSPTPRATRDLRPRAALAAALIITLLSATGAASAAPASVLVTLDPQGGALPAQPAATPGAPAAAALTLAVTPGEAYGALPVPARDGHAFHGWWTLPDGTGALITPGAIVAIPAAALAADDGDTAAAALTLYAKWEPLPPPAPTAAAFAGARAALAASVITGTYVVIDLAGGTAATTYPVTTTTVAPELNEANRTTKLWLRVVPSGTFLMGSYYGGAAGGTEIGRTNSLNEVTGNLENQHPVTLTQPFCIGVFEVTQKQYELVTGTNPSYYVDRRDTYPVGYVYYNDIRGADDPWPASNAVAPGSFLGKLRAKTGLALDLPTDAQWEYACRAGTTTALNDGTNLSHTTNASPSLNALARNDHNRTDNKDGVRGVAGGAWSGIPGEWSAVVGSYAPNAWGLYDMHGNIWELCLDWYQPDPGSDPVTDPKGPATGHVRPDYPDFPARVLRGGGYSSLPWVCRSALRYPQRTANQGVGFRLSSPVPALSDPGTGGNGNNNNTGGGGGGAPSLPLLALLALLAALHARKTARE